MDNSWLTCNLLLPKLELNLIERAKAFPVSNSRIHDCRASGGAM